MRQGSDFGIPNPTQQIEVRIELDPIAEQRSRQGIESLGSQLRAVAESLQPFDTRADLTPQTGQRAVLTPHHVVAQRAQASIGRLDERLAQAKADGLMTFFNSQYISSPRFSISPCPAPSGFTTTPMSSFTGSPSSMERLRAIRTRLRE